MKKSIKKVFAVGVSAALLATTMVGALADLSSYPAPFVDDNGVFNGAIVVGENAATQDVLGAIDIAASLQSEAKKSVSVGGETVVEGGKDFALALSTASSAATYDDGDLEGFADSKVKVDGTEYDFHEELSLTTGLTVEVSSETSYQEEDDYGMEPYMELASGAVSYDLIFDDVVPIAALDTKDMEIKFLGKSITITDFEAGKVTLETSSENYLVEGDVKSIDGHEVKLVSVGENAVIVSVDGQTKVLSTTDDNKEFEDADDYTVELGSIFYRADAVDNGATLTLGTDISKTYEDGDALEIFDGEDDDKYSTWIWDITATDDNLTSIGIELNQAYNRVRSSVDDDERNAIAMGDELSLPNNYAAVEFVGYDESEMAKYDTLEISFDVVDLYDESGDTKILTDAKVIVFESSADEPFVIGATDEETNTVFVYTDGTNYTTYYDDGNDYVFSGETDTPFHFKLDNEAVAITPDADNTADAGWTVGFSGETLTLDVKSGTATGYDRFGSLAEEEDSDAEFDLGSITDASDVEEKSVYGITVDNVEGMLDDDMLVLNVPYAKQEAKIVVKSTGSSVIAGSTGSAYMVNPIEVGMGMLDSEATLGKKPMIVIGGPAANSIANELLGYPTEEELMATFSEGKAMIKWFEDEQAMLVAGWSAQDTRGASYVVADYDEYDFSGSELEVVVTDLKNIDVMAK